jgi:uncharacterized membrane protein
MKDYEAKRGGTPEVAEAVREFYELHPYPPPVDDLDRYKRLWNDLQRRRVDAHLFWPTEPYREDRSVLVAGCGTSQAAKYALRQHLAVGESRAKSDLRASVAVWSGFIRHIEATDAQNWSKDSQSKTEGLMKEWMINIGGNAVIIINAMGFVVIAAGTIEAFLRSASTLFNPSTSGELFRNAYLRYARWLVAGLTFQLAADIIGTSIAPTWDEVGRLGAVAVIRTFLNFFLERDISEAEQRPKREE